jgi:hypothetical protein
LEKTERSPFCGNVMQAASNIFQAARAAVFAVSVPVGKFDTPLFGGCAKWTSSQAKCRRMNIRDVLVSERALLSRATSRGGPMTTLEQFSGLVADIYDAALDPALWERTLKHVFSVAGAKNAALVVYDREKRRRPQIIAANFEPTQSRSYDDYYGLLDPLAPILRRTPVGVIVTARAVTTESQRHGEFYNDWAHPNETGDTVFVNVLDSTSGVCTFMMGHPWRSEPFVTPDVLRLVGLLAPHFQRAMQAQLGFGASKLVRDGAFEVIDRWRHGCVFVSCSGRVLYANPAATDIAAARDGLSLGCRGLRTVAAAEDATLQRLIRQTAGDEYASRASGRMAISRVSGRKPYTIQVLPIGSSHARLVDGPGADRGSRARG